MRKRRGHSASLRCGQSRAGLRSARRQESGDGWPSLEQILYNPQRGIPKSQKESGPGEAAFPWNFTRSYFGGGVVVPPLFFLAFLPPLCLFFPVLVVFFLPPSAGLSGAPPVAWANDRVAPS